MPPFHEPEAGRPRGLVIFVTADERVKVLDFGLAKLTQPEPAFAAATALPTTPPHTLPGVVLGTIGYMSPEQVRGLTADHRSDIFAFGAILYEALGPLDSRGVYVGSLDSPDAHRLFETDSPAEFLPPDSVLFRRDGSLLAQRLNLDTLQMEGDPVPVATRVALGNFNSVAVSSSISGLIAYRAHAGARQSFWVDRSGRQIGMLGGPDAGQPTTSYLSRDGRFLALQRTVNGNVDIWVIDVERGGARRMTVRGWGDKDRSGRSGRSDRSGVRIVRRVQAGGRCSDSRFCLRHATPSKIVMMMAKSRMPPKRTKNPVIVFSPRAPLPR